MTKSTNAAGAPEFKYVVINFDIFQFLVQLAIVLLISLGVSMLDSWVSQGEWVKSGENYVLFVSVFAGGLLYGFSLSAFFIAGQKAWHDLVDAVSREDYKAVERLKDQKPDIFPVIIAVGALALLIFGTAFVVIPGQMEGLRFFTNAVLLMAIFIAFDYWGYDSGIKRIQKVPVENG